MPKPARFSSPEVLARIKKLGFRARQAVHGTQTGVNRSPLLGQSVEFVDYRVYTPGDDLKKLDWKAYARNGRYVIKLYEEESNIRAHLILDGSESMRYGNGPLDKYAYAATLVASLATLMIEQRDSPSLMIFDQEERDFLPPATTRLHLSQIIEHLEASTPSRTTSLGSVLKRKVGELPRRGVIFLVSDMLTDLDEFSSALLLLKQRGHEIVLFHVLDRDELELPFEGQIEFKDLEVDDKVLAEPKYFREAYKAAMQEFCRDVEKRVTEVGAEYRMLTTDEDLGLALSFYLHRRERELGRGRQGAGAGRATGPIGRSGGGN